MIDLTKCVLERLRADESFHPISGPSEWRALPACIGTATADDTQPREA